MPSYRSRRKRRAVSVSAFYAPTACYQQCLASADCEALSAAYCRTDLELLLFCDERCAFRCADGSLLGVERLCNGTPECPGGDDEAACQITCANGVVAMGGPCDGVFDCPDSSDERECVPRCSDGRYVLPMYRCDGRRHCPDGSDGAGCLEFACAGGRTLRYVGDEDTPRCNGPSECGDGGSDERGCARVAITCGR